MNKQLFINAEFHILESFDENYRERVMSMDKLGLIVYHEPVPDVRSFHQKCFAICIDRQ